MDAEWARALPPSGLVIERAQPLDCAEVDCEHQWESTGPCVWCSAPRPTGLLAAVVRIADAAAVRRLRAGSSQHKRRSNAGR